MNQQRTEQLATFLQTLSDIERERAAGTHVSRLSLIPYDEQRRAYNFGAFPGGAVSSIRIAKHDRFAETPLHYHGYIELNLMCSGRCTQVIEGQEVTLEPGVFVLVDWKAAHSISYCGEDDILVNVLLNKGYLAQKLLTALPQGNLLTTFFVNALNSGSRMVNYLVFGAGDNDRLASTVGELLYEAFFPSELHKQIIDQLFLLMVMDLLPAVDTRVMHAHLSGSNLVVVEALEWIDEHYLDASLEDAARAVGVSAPYLTTLLKRSAGASFTNLVLKKRMAHAGARLLASDASVEQIARECGYENLTFFYRKFREAHGCTPRELRERNQRI